MKCVTKPAEYDCVQWNGNNYEEIKKFCGDYVYHYDRQYNSLNVLYAYSQKWQTCWLNDWIIKTGGGYYRVIKNDDFKRLYELK